MNSTVFRVAKMDCPSEEQLIRLKLGELPEIKALEFNLEKRLLTVVHEGNYEAVFRKLSELGLDTSYLETAGLKIPVQVHDTKGQTRLLWKVLAINLFFFVLELIFGWLAGSMGLLADGLDMLADSIVYGLALYAAGRAAGMKTRIARLAGYFQLILALTGLAETLRRFFVPVPMPEFQTMMIVSALALAGNVSCLYLLQKSKSTEAHMKASIIFTSSDVIANMGVILAGGIVMISGSLYPDLIAGFIVFLLVIRGTIKIMRL